MNDAALIRDHHDSLRIVRRADIPLNEIRSVLDAGGELLKKSNKSCTRRVGSYVIKSTQWQYGLGPLKLTLTPGRYRRAWNAAVYLERQGVHVPTPYAFVVRRRFGITWNNTVITRYLEGACDVEAFADRHLLGSEHADAARAYLLRLADAVNRLCASGAYHADLSGKNILTQDGRIFWFIDLDSVRIGRPYTRRWRMRNHIQLYDSFCDRWSPSTLRPFIERLEPPETDSPDAWFDQVREGQRCRRARHEARYRPHLTR